MLGGRRISTTNSIAVKLVIPAAPPGREVHRGMTLHIPVDELESPEESKKKTPD
jgi:hypothetical protein